MDNGRGKDIFSTHDAAKICRVTPMTVIRWIKEGKIPAFKTAGGHRRIQRPDLEKFCRARGIPFSPDEADVAGRILVVDADPAMRDAIADAARACDDTLTIEHAGDAFAAGRLVATFRPGLVFLDPKLAGVDTLELVARLARDPDTASMSVVLVAGQAGPDLERAYRARGATAVIRRPPQAAVVERVVRQAFQLVEVDEDAPHTSPLTVVIVDNDARTTRLVKKEIEERSPGARVAVYDTCIDALLAVGAERPDFKLLDVGRDDMDCVEMIKRVQARHHPAMKHVEVIAICDPDKESMRAAVAAAGARDFFVKPLQPGELMKRLEERRH